MMCGYIMILLRKHKNMADVADAMEDLIGQEQAQTLALFLSGYLSKSVLPYLSAQQQGDPTHATAAVGAHTPAPAPAPAPGGGEGSQSANVPTVFNVGDGGGDGGGGGRKARRGRGGSKRSLAHITGGASGSGGSGGGSGGGDLLRQLSVSPHAPQGSQTKSSGNPRLTSSQTSPLFEKAPASILVSSAGRTQGCGSQRRKNGKKWVKMADLPFLSDVLSASASGRSGRDVPAASAISAAAAQSLSNQMRRSALVASPR